MAYQRRHFSRDEIALHRGPAASTALWPVVSIGLLCLLSLLLPAGLTTLLNGCLLFVVGAVWLAGRGALPAPLAAVMACFGGIAVTGLFAGAGAPTYLYLKDAWYCANPALVLLVGCVLGGLARDARRVLRALVLGGSVVAALHLFIIWRRLDLADLLNLPAAQLRAATGLGYEAAALVLLLAAGTWGRWRAWLGMPPAAVLACAALCSTSLVLSFSRTLLLVVAVGGLGLSGFFARHAGRRLLGLLAVLIGLAFALQLGVATNTSEARLGFMGKLAGTVEEIQPDDRLSVGEANARWRGYETARAWATWSGGSPLQWLFGQGFGAQVDLGYFQNLTPNPREASRFIPVLHNGYAYLLVKTGVIGVGLYAWALWLLYRHGGRAAGLEAAPSLRRLQGRLLQACALVLGTTTWFVAGAFNKFDMFAFLMAAGCLIATLAAPATPAGVTRAP